MKTAEEMFAELGYKRVECDKGIRFFSIDFPDWYSITLFSNGDIEKTDELVGEAVYFKKAEILACAQLIREMEEINKNE